MRIDSQATRAFDNVSKQVIPLHGFDLTHREVDLHLLDHGSDLCALHYPDGARLDVRASPDFARWVIWTLGGKDFVCVEPWTAPGNALNTGEALTVLAAGAAYESWVDISLVRN
jgi:galactose mutarotase-like enzyme